MTEQLAVIRDPHVAVEDHTGRLNVVFTTYIREGIAASQWIDPRSDRFYSLWESMRGNVKNLDGLVCMVDVDTHFIKFLCMTNL